MSSKAQLTLFLWPAGLFPRRVTYWLVLKGLVSSYSDILAGKTADPNLSIVRLGITPPKFGWTYEPADDPLPASVSTSTPCLRVRDAETGAERWVRESSSIIAYLERAYAGRGPALAPAGALDAAATGDLVGQLNLALAESATYLRHASPQLAVYAELRDEDRSRAAARVGHRQFVRGLAKVQAWAADSLATTGWLTPGTDGPGLVDVNLAAPRRYLELAYGWDLFEDEELKPLDEWYKRFQKLPWWDALEGGPNIHPAELKFTIEKFEI
ncbi:hypothetical protein SAMD00023353_7000410 [Rosellinia necatrix]|uniref:Glutathione S-transferase n=1 Tax=Rosellinia necatrix TaxID=77044 RepID=A0A1W2TJZ7_ROSNE|nr:hypothetical protein SAMD00023353_7000410 [Rosellinia necatrix]